MSSRRDKGVKRFYREAAATDVEGGTAVTLDGRPVKTPAKRSLVVLSAALADAIADEWRAQQDQVRPETMPLTRLAATAIDRVADARDRVVDEIAGYAATDLVCYRVAAPTPLAARQRDGWQPLLDWLGERYGAGLAVTDGITAIEQPRDALDALRAAVDGFDDAGLAALHNLTTACSSLVIALALADGRIDAEQAWALSRIDERYQAEQWGEDADATARQAVIRAQFIATARFLELSRV